MIYRDSSRLLGSVRSADLLVIARDSNAQSGYSTETERHIGGRFSDPAYRTDNADRKNQVCSGHRVFLANRNSSQNTMLAHLAPSIAFTTLDLN